MAFSETDRPILRQLCAVLAREKLFGLRKRQVTLGALSHPSCGSHSCNFSPGSANLYSHWSYDASVSVQAPMRARKSHASSLTRAASRMSLKRKDRAELLGSPSFGVESAMVKC